MAKHQFHRQVRAYEAVIAPSTVGRLRRLVVACQHVCGLAWYEFAAGPANFFEQVVDHLRQFADPERQSNGVEYWMRVQRSNSDFLFHFDRDEAVQERVVSPMVSSILYLSRVGGPTLITDATPLGGLPRVASAVFPSPGRFAVFPGQLFHGVGEGRNTRWPRIAFFANWWKEQPAAAQVSNRLVEIAHEIPGWASRRRPPRRHHPRVLTADKLADEATWQALLQRNSGYHR